uniref:Major facilitator superfamily (MFS) profile domain-containing protein n=1 Tax=Photinus pyralis TaxID=7054 RepID=A0A1Y1K1B9_PHOPY
MKSSKYLEMRRVLSQVIAVMAKNFLMVLEGMSVGYVTILIASLTDRNSNETIILSEAQTSWISSISPISSLVGCYFSGLVSDRIGRKRALISLTIPNFIGWIGYYFAKEPWHIFATLALHGITSSFTEAPVLTYVAEVTEPHLRGALSTTTTLAMNIGMLLETFICSMLHWRTAALVTCSVPILTLCMLMIVPETPYWLLLQNRCDEARKSLAWLRGWVSVAEVEEEFQEIQKGCSQREADTSVIKPTQYFKRSFVIPFSLLAFLMIWSSFIGIGPTTRYSAVIFSTFNVPINKFYAVVLMSASGMLGSVLCIFSIKHFGKRKTAISSIFAFCMCHICIGIYAYMYNVTNLKFTTENMATSSNDYQWIPLLLLSAFSFIAFCGPKNLPWVLIGEVFPNEARAVGCGLISSVFYISSFAANLAYLDMIALMSFPGVYWTFAFVCFIGLLITYFLVPETEGKTLQQVADYYNEK